MPDPIPGPSSRSSTAPTLYADEGRIHGILIQTGTRLTVEPRVTIAESFDNLSDWQVVYAGQIPTISSDNITGVGAIRHKTQTLTDSPRATAVVASSAIGRTRIGICADPTFSTYYAVEIERGILVDNINFLKGTPRTSVQSGLVGSVNTSLDLLFGLFSFFTLAVIPSATVANTPLVGGDQISIWYDDVNSIVRIGKNGLDVLVVPVPRGEIPHGTGHRNHGVAVGVGTPDVGAAVENYECLDIGALSAAAAPTGIASGELFGTTVVLQSDIIAPTGITSGEAFGTAALSTGDIDIFMSTGIPTAAAFGTLTVDPRNLYPTTIATSEAFGLATVT